MGRLGNASVYAISNEDEGIIPEMEGICNSRSRNVRSIISAFKTNGGADANAPEGKGRCSASADITTRRVKNARRDQDVGTSCTSKRNRGTGASYISSSLFS